MTDGAARRSTVQGPQFIGVAVFLGVFAAHCSSPVVQGCDSRWVLHRSMSLLLEGNTDLDEYADLIGREDQYMVEEVNGRHYDAFPIGTSVLAMPLVVALEAVEPLRGHASLRQNLMAGYAWGEQKALASMFVAATAAVIYLIGWRRMQNRCRSLVLVLLFAFCTSAWSTASRSLWQHGPSMLLLAATILAFVLAEEHPPWIVPAGALLAFSYVVRPTNAVAVVVLTVLALARHPKRFVPFLLSAAVVTVPFIAFNQSLYGTLLPGYFRLDRLGNRSFVEALAGNLVSPARGLLVYSPVLVLSFVGMALKMREHLLDGLDVSAAAIIVLHWLAISSYAHWWGGHSFGPRLFTDVLPCFVYLLIPALTARPSAGMVTALVLLSAASFFTNASGAIRPQTMVWNVSPANVDEHPERLWDWSDPQFLR